MQELGRFGAAGAIDLRLPPPFVTFNPSP